MARNTDETWDVKPTDYQVKNIDKNDLELRLPIDRDMESACLAALLKYPETVIAFIDQVKLDDFAYPANQNIFKILKDRVDRKEKIDSIFLKSHLNLIGNSPFQGITTDDYIDSLINLETVVEDNSPDYFARLMSMGLARRVIIDAKNLAVKIRKIAMTANPAEIIEVTERFLGDILTVDLKGDDKPQDIYAGMEEYLLSGEIDENRVFSPYPCFNDFYGDIRRGSLSVFCAGYGQGKSTMLSNMVAGMLELPKNNAMILQLDTEMSTELNKNRLIAHISGVGEYYISSKEWRLHKDMREKVFKAIEIIKTAKDKGMYHHLYVGNKPMTKIISIIKRFHYLNVPKEKNFVIAYDYIKIATGEVKGGNHQEWQALGEKTDSLQKLMGEIDIRGLGAVQGTAEGAIAGSRRIADFCDNAYLLLEKPLEERTNHGIEFGTHRLSAIKTRFQGPNAQGFNKFLMVEQEGSRGKKIATPNFINYDFDNFTVTEKGTLAEIIEANKQSSVTQLGGAKSNRVMDDDDDIDGI